MKKTMKTFFKTMKDRDVIWKNKNRHYVNFDGPWHCPFNGGRWQVMVTFSVQQPDQCPAVQFLDKIYHPNVDFQTGIFCERVADSYWESHTSDLDFVFDRILFEELFFGPKDVGRFINEEAGNLWRTDRAAYEARARVYCFIYATPPRHRLLRLVSAMLPMRMWMTRRKMGMVLGQLMLLVMLRSMPW